MSEKMRWAILGTGAVANRFAVSLNNIPDQAELVGKLVLAAQKLAKDQGIAEDGYRLVMNCNERAGQTVFHIHLHVLGGRAMTWPPG